MRPTRARLAFVVTIPLFVIAPEAVAQQKQPSAAQKTTARNLLLDCREKVTKKDLQAALKSCQGAHAIMGVPSTGLDLAKVQELVGQLVEARETALEVVRFDNAANNPTFTTAQQEAQQLAASLATRIPSLVLNVSGPAEDTDVTIRVDKDDVPPAAFSLPYKVNPGSHLVVVFAKGFEKIEQTVAVQERQTKTLDLKLARVAPSAESATVAEYEPAGKDKPTGGSSKGVPTWAWIAGGVGVAGVAVAIVGGLKFSGIQAQVANDCPANQCRPELSPAYVTDLQSSWNTYLTVTIVGSVVSAAGIGAAIYGIVAAPRKEAAFVVPWVSPSTGGLVAVGRF